MFSFCLNLSASNEGPQVYSQCLQDSKSLQECPLLSTGLYCHQLREGMHSSSAMQRDTHNPVKYHFLTGIRNTKGKERMYSSRTGINMAVAFAAGPSVLEKSTGYAQEQEDFC